MEAADAGAMTGIVWRRINPAHEAEAEALMHKLMQLSRTSEGYMGSEIFPPIAGVQDAHVVLYRFDSGDNLRRWLAHPVRAETLRRMETLLLEPSIEFFFAHRRQQPGTASSVFSYRIRSGCEEAFRDWRHRIYEAVRSWEGYLGTESFDTLDTAQPEFIVVVRFDTRAHADAWLGSPQRAQFIGEVHRYVEDYQVRRLGTGFEGWFEYGDHAAPPAAWRQGMVVLTALFPIITVLRHLMSPLFEVFPMPVAFLILLAADCSLLTFFVMPRFSRAMKFWLRPGVPYSWAKELAGLAILLGILAVTLVFALLTHW